MADSAILAAGGGNAPLHYKVPGAAVIRIKQVHVHYTDNGALTDWLPMVRIVSDSGHTMGQAADQAVKVTAGNDAATTFHPGVKHAAATPAAGVQAAYAILSLSVANFTDTGFTVANNTVTNVRFPHQSATDSVPFAFLPSTTYSDTIRLRSDAYFYVCHSSVRWHLAGFNQYSSIIGPSPSLPGSFLFGALNNHGETPANQFSAGDLFSGSPLWGVDTKTFVCETAPQDVTLTAFQTAGADRVIDEANLLCIAYTF